MIEQRFVQFSKQFTRIENRTFGRASWSVLDDYFLFQNNYNKGKMGYVAVKIWVLPSSSRETHGYTITAVAVSTENRASPCYATKSLIFRNCLMSSFLIFEVLYEVGYMPHSNKECASPPLPTPILHLLPLSVRSSWCNAAPRYKHCKDILGTVPSVNYWIKENEKPLLLTALVPLPDKGLLPSSANRAL